MGLKNIKANSPWELGLRNSRENSHWESEMREISPWDNSRDKKNYMFFFLIFKLKKSSF